MKGTEKQIKWAKDIMNGAIGTVLANIDRLQPYVDRGEKPERIEQEVYKEMLEMLSNKFDSIDDAAYVIEHRHTWDPARINELVSREAEKRRLAIPQNDEEKTDEQIEEAIEDTEKQIAWYESEAEQFSEDEKYRTIYENGADRMRKRLKVLKEIRDKRK